MPNINDSEIEICYIFLVSKVKVLKASKLHENFGLQWNKFRTTQLDSKNGTEISLKRLERIIGKNYKDSLKGKRVLEVGCGAGRFSEILVQHAKELVCIDASNAIFACEETLSGFNNVDFYLSTIEEFVTRDKKFDVIFCVGVLQHTKNYKSNLSALVGLLKPGGLIYLDFYRWKWKNLPPPIGGAGNVFRFFVKYLKAAQSFAVVEKVVKFFYPIHWKFRSSWVLQQILFRISPVRFYYPWLGLQDKESYYQWALLDTYDGSTDRYKHRTTLRKFSKLLNTLPLTEIQVWVGGNGIESRARKAN